MSELYYAQETEPWNISQGHDFYALSNMIDLAANEIVLGLHYLHLNPSVNEY